MTARNKKLAVGGRVRIAGNVTRTLWAVPCCWGGLEGKVTRTGARVNGIRFSRVAISDDCTFGGNDFADCVLEPVETVGIEDLL